MPQKSLQHRHLRPAHGGWARRRRHIIGRVHSSADQERALAEGVGFEPTIRFPVYTLSKRAPSATRPSLRASPKAKRLTALYSGAAGGQAKAGDDDAGRR